MWAILPDSLLWVISMGADIYVSGFCFWCERVFLCYDSAGSFDDKSLLEVLRLLG